MTWQRSSILLSLFALLLGSWLFSAGLTLATAEPAHTEAVTTETAVHAETTTAEDTGIVGLFGLNWKLFLAQLFNFGIILFVLWKWVWGPVTKGLADRTAKIEDSLIEAERINTERADFDTWKQSEVATMRQEAAAIITEAKQNAEALRQQTLEQTKLEQTKLVEQTQAKLAQEKDKLINDARGEIAGLVINATETILREKLTVKKDQELIDKALKQLK